jgi:hypothetical protein
VKEKPCRGFESGTRGRDISALLNVLLPIHATGAHEIIEEGRL